MKEFSREQLDERRKIAELLHSIGMPAGIKGYNYCMEAISYMLESDNVHMSITKELYPEIARRFHTTASRVERAIRHAIEVSYIRGDIDNLNSIFGCTINSNTGKPTNGEFLSMLVERIQLQLVY